MTQEKGVTVKSTPNVVSRGKGGSGHRLLPLTFKQSAKVQETACVLTAKERDQTCEGNNEQVLERFVFVFSQTTWASARDSCASLGVQLFRRFNGTKAQLNFFYDKIDNNIFWVGVTLGTNEWVDSEGK